MKNSVIFSPFSEEELRNLITEIISEQLSKFFSQTREKKSARLELLTRKETARKLGISLPTLQRLTSNGTIPAKRVGTSSRILYCIEDIEAALKDIYNPKKK